MLEMNPQKRSFRQKCKGAISQLFWRFQNLFQKIQYYSIASKFAADIN